MEWIKNYDILFLREVRVLDLYEIRKGSLERGKLWDEIVERFNSFLYFIINLLLINGYCEISLIFLWLNLKLRIGRKKE